MDVDPGELRVRFRVFVVYYDVVDESHAPLPEDPGYFLSLLWENAHDGEISEFSPMMLITLGQVRDDAWLKAEAHRYVRRVERVETRNHPVERWDGQHDFYYLRGGGWKDEDLLVQADYDVEVTHARWLEGLRPGRTWATASMDRFADQVSEDEAPTVLDLRAPALTLKPFPDRDDDSGTPSDLAFSDDGRYLAVTSQACALTVFRTGDWSVHAHVADSPLWGQDVMWVPGTHLLTMRPNEDTELPTAAYDVDTGEEVEIPPQEYRPNPSATVSGGNRRAIHPDRRHSVALGRRTGPGFGDEQWLELRRVADGALLMRCRSGGAYVGPTSWSPDGSLFAASVTTGGLGYGGAFHIYRPGPAVAPAEEPDAASVGLEELLAGLYTETAKVALFDGLIAREPDPHVAARLCGRKAEVLVGGYGDRARAAEAYQRAVELGNDDTAMRSALKLGLLLRRLQDHDGAVEAARTARRLAEAGAEREFRTHAALLLGDALKARGGDGDYPAACDALQEGLDLGGEQGRNRALIMGHLGELHYWQGSREGARAWYERMLPLTEDPELVAEGSYRLGEYAAADGDRERAAEHLRRAAGTGYPGFSEQAAELLERL
ncbi:tetratricopeptide repeat protein [Nonomuraea longicatena]|uniref:tetratricopeptide repeat protein n=1 Tax=Nonomuraea longicatena TaxID=83682 RepID=UPI0031D7BBB0